MLRVLLFTVYVEEFLSVLFEQRGPKKNIFRCAK